MLAQAFNDLVFPMSHEDFNAFIRFNGHVHDNVKVVQYSMSHPIVFNFFHLTKAPNL